MVLSLLVQHTHGMGLCPCSKIRIITPRGDISGLRQSPRTFRYCVIIGLSLARLVVSKATDNCNLPCDFFFCTN